ncbi:hypothetical protein ACWFMI_23335 [Nocardiopsis terrae]|uniref:hypothetical protein n=1 Tax=Streptomyces sp. NPDC057554 TaxID=3350538 RepID=UPI003691DD31
MSTTTNLTLFGREPVEWLAVIQSVLLVGVTLGVPWLPEGAVPAIVAFLGALFGAYQAVLVRPLAPAAFTGVVTTLAPLVAAYGLHLDPELVAAINALIVAALTHPTRGQVSPKDKVGLAA